MSDLSPATVREAASVEQERLVGAIAQRIRHTLNLQDLVTIAAQELGELLDVDRVEIVQYLPKQQLWRHLAEYRRNPNAPSFMGQDIPDQNNPLAEQLKRFEVVQIADVNLVNDEINQRFAQVSPGAWLLLPLRIGTLLWGSLSLVRHQSGDWQTADVALIQAGAEQLMIAIEHSQLYQQVQQLNDELEQTVKQRTAQLSQALASESMLKRITDKVRDSLDENYILETVVEELATLLTLNYCATGLYNASRNTCTIAYEHTTVLPPAQGKAIDMTREYPDIYEQLLGCQPVQCCLLDSAVNRMTTEQTLLACPIFDNQGVLGDLWLFRPEAHMFDELEVRLVQQVTNQCAIAIRQARLYQAAQSQVETLEHLNELKDTFLSTVSDALRTPISIIKMASQMLTLTLGREGLLPDPNKPSLSSNKIAHYLKILNDECNREIGLITDLLDLQRLEAGIHNFIAQPVEMDAYLRRILRPFQDQAEAHQQTLHIEIASDLPNILTDPQSLERILVELLTNACKYTPAGENIWLSAQTMQSNSGAVDRQAKKQSRVSHSDPAIVQIHVINSGVEIPPDQLSHVFEKFYRITGSDPNRHSGMGVGLALVKRLTMRIGGKVSVTSGEGQTCFTLELPVGAPKERWEA